MCAICGCDGEAKPSVLDLQTGRGTAIEPPAPEHIHADGTVHGHSHDHDHHHAPEHGTMVALEARILAKNDCATWRNKSTGNPSSIITAQER